MRHRWVVALIPGAAGILIAALLTDVPMLHNPIMFLRADAATLAIIGGLAISVPTAMALALRERYHQGWLARLETTREESAEERRRFLRRLDHELKNPLTAIRAGLTNISNGSDQEGQTQALASVEAQVLRLGRLTSDLRRLADLETRPLDMATVNLGELVREAVSLAEDIPGARERRFSLSVSEVPWPIPAIAGDWDLVLLAVYNLLDNAIKFTQPGDAVEIRAFEDMDTVAIEVADTGPGVPGEDLPHVWEELYRGRDARGVPGSGLGLALVQAIVDRHGGRVSIRSRAGQGTVVTMRFPIQ